MYATLLRSSSVVEADKGLVENGSRPPSPPESGTTTPRLSIAPCPIRLQPLIPPMNYGAVDLHNIYRSSFPQDRNVDFLHALRIKTTLYVLTTAVMIIHEGY